jgi:hypothetical protein
MQAVPTQLNPAQDEVHRTTHNQDLIEVSKRALFDREAENDNDLRMPQGAGRVSVTNL